MALFGRKRKKQYDPEIVTGQVIEQATVTAVAGQEFTITLPNDIAAGRNDAVKIVAGLPDDLNGCVVVADGSGSSFLGPIFVGELVEQVCLKRGALLDVREVETKVGERFIEASFLAGVTTKVHVGGTVPFGVAIRRRPVLELTAG